MLELPAASIKRIQNVYPRLKRVQELTGVPWQAMAAIWYRESFTITPPKTPGGPFQFDPVPSRGTLKGLLKRFTKLDDQAINDVLLKGVNDFDSGALLSACFLRNKTGPVITPTVDDETIKDAFYGYNGRKYGSVEKSPYVMNGYDSARLNMELRGTIPDGHGGRRWVEIVDKRPGAFTVYKQLKKLFP